MTACRNSRIFRLALAFAVTLSLLSAPLGPSGSHDPAALAQAEAERHAALAEPHGDPGHTHGQEWGHDHEHEDGWPAERHAGHAHGHDPADHSHDVPAPPAFVGQGFLKLGGAWHAPAPSSHEPGPSFGIDRPPRA